MSIFVVYIIGLVLIPTIGLTIGQKTRLMEKDGWSILYPIFIIFLYLIFFVGLTYLVFEKGEKTLIAEKNYSIVKFNSNYELSSDTHDEEHLYKIEDCKVKDLKTDISYVYIIDENEKYKKIDIRNIADKENLKNQEIIIEREYKYTLSFIYYNDFEYSLE